MQVIIYAPNASSVILDNCSMLGHALIWSNQLTALKFPGCDEVKRLDLRCPQLATHDHERFLQHKDQPRPEHPPLRDLAAQQIAAAAAGGAAQHDAHLKLQCTPAGVPEVYRCGAMSQIGAS